MAVTAADMKFKYSGGAANALATACLGGVRSSVDIPAGSQNLFDDVTPSEATSGDTEYRCFYVYNDNDTDTINAVKVWMNGDTPAPGTVGALGLDPATAGDGQTTGVAVVIANEQTAPAGVAFSAATSEGAALDIGSLGPNQGRAVWMRRTVSAAAAAYAGDGAVLQLKGTPA
jgi:hypothetical protein